MTTANNLGKKYKLLIVWWIVSLVVYIFSPFFISFEYILAQEPATTLTNSTSWHLTIPVAPNTSLVVEKSGTEQETKHLLVSDYLSSTRTILAEDGTITNTPSYYPYGSQFQSFDSTQDNPVSTNSNKVTNRFYTGQRKVSDTDNIYNYNARYYNPEIGLFTQPDTVEGLNKYAYVGSNPIMKNDPSGHTKSCIWGDSPLAGGASGDPAFDWLCGGAVQDEDMAPPEDPAWYAQDAPEQVNNLSESINGFTDGLAESAVAVGNKISGDSHQMRAAGASGGGPLVVIGVVATAIATGLVFGRSKIGVQAVQEVARPQVVRQVANEFIPQLEDAGNITLAIRNRMLQQGIGFHNMTAEEAQASRLAMRLYHNSDSEANMFGGYGIVTIRPGYRPSASGLAEERAHIMLGHAEFRVPDYLSQLRAYTVEAQAHLKVLRDFDRYGIRAGSDYYGNQVLTYQQYFQQHLGWAQAEFNRLGQSGVPWNQFTNDFGEEGLNRLRDIGIIH